VAWFDVRGAAGERVRKMQEEGERDGKTDNATARGGMSVLDRERVWDMERETSRQMKMGRARRKESVARAMGNVCWV
jgi:hypothetical protein